MVSCQGYATLRSVHKLLCNYRNVVPLYACDNTYLIQCCDLCGATVMSINFRVILACAIRHITVFMRVMRAVTRRHAHTQHASTAHSAADKPYGTCKTPTPKAYQDTSRRRRGLRLVPVPVASRLQSLPDDPGTDPEYFCMIFSCTVLPFHVRKNEIRAKRYRAVACPPARGNGPRDRDAQKTV